MEQTLQQAAKEYAEEVYRNSSEIEEWGLAAAFEDGAEWQKKQSSWINVKDAMPKAGEVVVWFSVDNSEGFIGELEENKKQITKYDADGEISMALEGRLDLWWIPVPKLSEKDRSSKKL